MKTCNFPEKVNKRRMGAMQRLIAKRGITYPEVGILNERIVSDARDIRTKKYRGK